MTKPALYIVPTPIGNLRDITLRALDVLKHVDLIVCEDTRHTIKLLNHYDIKKPMISYEKFSEAKRIRHIIDQLDLGHSIALVSDAGTPLVSDPGSLLISRVRERGIKIEALPGASAIITIVSASGFEGPFRFMGFFPRQKTAQKMELLRMSISIENAVFFESPHRILKTLSSIYRTLGDRQICLAREISKLHEEYLLGSAKEVYDKLEHMGSIGEITVIVKGTEKTDSIDESYIKMRAQDLMKSGHSKKDILHVLSQETGMKRNQLYEMLLKLD
jgi:16S rRNA (cytidine1402-2'-O)-methyltransferase